jgi:hypothetical protein
MKYFYFIYTVNVRGFQHWEARQVELPSAQGREIVATDAERRDIISFMYTDRNISIPY